RLSRATIFAAFRHRAMRSARSASRSRRSSALRTTSIFVRAPMRLLSVSMRAASASCSMSGLPIVVLRVYSQVYCEQYPRWTPPGNRRVDTRGRGAFDVSAAYSFCEEGGVLAGAAFEPGGQRGKCPGMADSTPGANLIRWQELARAERKGAEPDGLVWHTP